MSNRFVPRSAILALPLLTLSPSMAFAHAGHDQGHHNALISGVMHPFLGLDHLLAMIAVGLWASHLRLTDDGRTALGRRAIWLVPGSFVLAMCLGAVLAIAGIELPGVEAIIASSVLVLGLCAAIMGKAPCWLAACLAACFAVFHGHAHGLELAPGLSSAGYMGGFVLGTMFLHAIGVLLGLAAGMTQQDDPVRRFAFQGGGGIVAASGALMIVGLI